MRFALIFLFFIVTAFAGEFDTANQLYESGDCENAIPLYEKVIAQDIPEKDLALFRKSYCHHSLGQHELAVQGFQKYVDRHPLAGEAKFRLAESLYELERYLDSVHHLKGIMDRGYWHERKLLYLQNLLALDRIQDAMQFLQSMDLTGREDLKPVVAFWKGYVAVQDRDLDRAADRFRECVELSGDEGWTRSTCKEWLESVESFWSSYSISAGGGGMWDGNLSQGTKNGYIDDGSDTYRSVVVDDTKKGLGYTGKFTGNFRLNKIGRYTLALGADAFLYHYFSNTDYNFESVTAFLDHRYRREDGNTFGVETGLSTQRYNLKRYRDYATVKPYYLLQKENGTVWKYSIPIYYRILGGTEVIFGLNVDGVLDKDWGAVFFGIGLTRTNGEKPEVVAGVLEKGEMFSRYISGTVYVGSGVEVLENTMLYADVAATFTGFDDQGTTQDTTTVTEDGTALRKPTRNDTTFALSLKLSRPITDGGTKLQLTGSYTANTSHGYQGLTSSDGYVHGYTYTRPMLLLELLTEIN